METTSNTELLRATKLNVHLNEPCLPSVCNMIWWATSQEYVSCSGQKSRTCWINIFQRWNNYKMTSEQHCGPLGNPNSQRCASVLSVGNQQWWVLKDSPDMLWFGWQKVLWMRLKKQRNLKCFCCLYRISSRSYSHYKNILWPKRSYFKLLTDLEDCSAVEFSAVHGGVYNESNRGVKENLQLSVGNTTAVGEVF